MTERHFSPVQWVSLNKAGSILRLAALAEQRIFGLMGNEYAGGVHVVLALKGTQTEIWAAATPRSEALEAVQAMLRRGWKTKLLASDGNQQAVSRQMFKPRSRLLGCSSV
jgi:hypothetical protein